MTEHFLPIAEGAWCRRVLIHVCVINAAFSVGARVDHPYALLGLVKARVKRRASCLDSMFEGDDRRRRMMSPGALPGGRNVMGTSRVLFVGMPCAILADSRITWVLGPCVSNLIVAAAYQRTDAN